MLPRKIRDFVKGDPELTKIFELLYNKDDTFFDQGVFILECLLDERPDWGITVLGDLKQLYSSSNPLVNSTENDEALIFKIVISLLEMEDATIDACLQDIRDLRIGRVPTLSPALSKLSTTRLVFNAHYKVRKHSWSSRKRLILPTWLSQPESEPLKVNHVTVPEISSHYSSHPILKEVLQIFRPVSLSWKGVTLRKRTGFWTVDNCCTAEWTNLQFLIQEAKALDVESIHHNNCLYRVDLRTLNWDQVSPLRSISWIEPDFWMDTVQQIKLSEAVELPLRERVLEITVTSLTSLDKLQFPNVQTIRCLEYAERLTADTWKCFPKLAVIDFGTAQKKVYTSKPPPKSFT